MTSELLGFTMFGVTMVALLLGFPVALTIAGSALIFAFIGDYFDLINLIIIDLFHQDNNFTVIKEIEFLYFFIFSITAFVQLIPLFDSVTVNNSSIIPKEK